MYMVLSDSREHYTRVAAPSTSDRIAFDGLPLGFTAADAFLATLDGASAVRRPGWAASR